MTTPTLDELTARRDALYRKYEARKDRGAQFAENVEHLKAEIARLDAEIKALTDV